MERESERERERARLCDVNSHLMCVLCGGYYIDATTICECLHSFCRSCIVKHLETSKFCPICDVQLHKNKPLLSIRPDKTLQRLVYKVVPGLYHSELQRRRQFYSSTDPQSSERQRDLLRLDYYSPEDSISLSLEYYDSSRVDEKKPEEKEEVEANAEEVQRRYLQCPAGVNILHLQKFLRMKYALHHDHRVDIYYHNKLLPETFTLVDVAYTFNWDRTTPMRFGFQILERHTVTVTNKHQVLVAESSPSTSLETSLQNTGSREAEEVRSEQSEQLRDLGLGKKKLRQSSSNLPEDSPTPSKKARSDIFDGGRSSTDSERTNDKSVLLVGNQSTKSIRNRVQELIESVKIDESNDSSVFSLDGKGEGSQVASLGGTEGSTADVADVEDAMEVDNVSQIADSVEDDTVADVNQDIEEVVVDVEGEPSQDFILQEDQPQDASEDLDDDDEDRLRICDPEEVPEEKSVEEKTEEQIETEPIQPEVEEEKLENLIEEETEVVRKEKSRRKNKKAKHHHRHKRDYSPTPEATIVPDDTSNVMKLRLKVINPNNESKESKNKNKQEEGSKHHRLSTDSQVSPKPSTHKNYVIAQDNDPSIQSPPHSTVDEDSRNSHSTDDHDARSVASAKEGHEETQTSKRSPLQNGNVESGKAKNKDISTKEKLLQMRQVRHKNITPPPPRPPPANTTISKVSAEEANKNAQKTPILLTSSSSSLTVSKVTAEEKMMMMTNNNLESKRPSLEIIMVNNPNKVVDKTPENQARQKSPPAGIPVVKLTKNNQLNSLMKNQQNALSVSKIKASMEVKNSESLKNSKYNKGSTDRRPVDSKKAESFGALDLSGKSNRSSGSSPVSERSNCPSPNQTALSMSQPLINRHLAASLNSPHRSSSNSPPVPVVLPKGSPTRAMQHPASMWNLMTLTDTAVHIRNIKAAQAQKGIVNNQKKPSPQRYPTMTPSSKTPSPRASPTQLKIPNPNNISNLASKFINRPKLPTSQQSVSNRVRPIGVNKPMVAMTRPMPSASPARPSSSFPNMMQSHSAAVAKKQAGINGRNINIPPPPPAIPISTLYKMESMARKYDLEKIARGLSAANKAAAGIPSS